MGRLLINTYAPLAATRSGREASECYRIPPFVDGSIRREPDLEHEYPAITCLCRADKFAPRLRVDDRVVYMTRKGRYTLSAPHWRLTAILRVARLLDTHAEAAAWYRSAGMALPNNCMVAGNPPNPVSKSHRINEHKQADDDQWTHDWDVGYRRRARDNGRVVVCEPLWRDLSWQAPVVHESDLLAALGRIPGTRNPGVLELNLLPRLTARLRIPLSPSAP